jgi:DNA repair ATPase RecN
VTGDVNRLRELIEEITQPEVEYYSDFKMDEALNHLEDKYELFWDAANQCRDTKNQDGDWAKFRDTISQTLQPLAHDYSSAADKLALNAPNMAVFCTIWQAAETSMEEILEQLDFNYSEFSEIDFDPEVLHNLKRVAQQSFSTMSELGDQLIEEWSPFGDYHDNGWRASFDEQWAIFMETFEEIEKHSNHVRSMFSKLWEIKKQVELTQNISSGHSSDDPAIRIEKLAGLLEKGLITKEEYDQKKSKLLEEI